MFIGSPVSISTCLVLLFVPLVAALAPAAAHATASADFAGLVDIGGGRKMYLECRGAGSPTVVLVAGLKASAEDWSIAGESATAVFPGSPSLPGCAPTTVPERRSVRSQAVATRWSNRPRRGMRLLTCMPC